MFFNVPLTVLKSKRERKLHVYSFPPCIYVQSIIIIYLDEL